MGIAVEACRSVDRIRDRILSGAPGAWEEYQALQKDLRTKSSSDAKPVQQKIDALLKSDRLGLARQFELIRETQSTVRQSVGQSLLASRK